MRKFFVFLGLMGLMLAMGAAVLLARYRAEDEGDEDDYYAAIAYSPSAGKWATCYGVHSLAEAEAGAFQNMSTNLGQLPNDARIVCHVKNGYCALAKGANPSLRGVGSAETDSEAKRLAIGYCRMVSPECAGLSLSVCSYPFIPPETFGAH